MVMRCRFQSSSCGLECRPNSSGHFRSRYHRVVRISPSLIFFTRFSFETMTSFISEAVIFPRNPGSFLSLLRYASSDIPASWRDSLRFRPYSRAINSFADRSGVMLDGRPPLFAWMMARLVSMPAFYSAAAFCADDHNPFCSPACRNVFVFAFPYPAFSHHNTYKG